MLDKAKEWWCLFVKVLNTDVRELWQATKVVKEKKSLAQLARENKVLGIKELPVLREIRRATCEHTDIIEKQMWVRVAPKKYELQNGKVCLKCASCTRSTNSLGEINTSGTASTGIKPSAIASGVPYS